MHPEQDAQREESRFEGIPVSPGVASGPLVVISHEEIRIPKYAIKESEIEGEISRFESALVHTREQILAIQHHLSQSIGERDASIFDAHLLVVEDATLVEAVKKHLRMKLLCVEYVYHHLMTSYARSMRELDDPYLQERAADLIDVGRRVLNNLMGRKVTNTYQLDEPSIILAHDLSPSDTAMLDRTLVLGFATDVGSPTSHTAIMARSLNIPAVVGLKDASGRIESGKQVVLDGYDGFLILDPSTQTRFEYGQIEKRRHEVTESLVGLRETRGVTKDGRRIILSANVEMPEDLPLLEEAGAEGIGLYRTEFLFLNRHQLPTEQEQYEAYRQVIQAGGDSGVIVRTLDLGGDKLPSSVDLGEELNPFLGWRAIRYCLEEIEVFKTQLRAICRAGHGLKMRIMFPMIATLEELLQAKATLHEVIEQLDQKAIPRVQEFEVGTMIEIPSAALIASHLAEHVDFFSIGTNDLIGYTLAVDRTNEKVANLYQPTHPALGLLIRRICEAAHEHGRWVGVCGEAAGDVILTPLLVGLGVDELSMGSISIPRVKKAVQTLDSCEMKQLADECLSMASANQVKAALQQVAQSHYPELLL